MFFPPHEADAEATKLPDAKTPAPNYQTRKETNQQTIIAGWPVDAQEQGRDRIVDWMVGAIPAREFVYASHEVHHEVLSRISILHFRSVWATKKFKAPAQSHQTDTHCHSGSPTTAFQETALAPPTS